MTYDVPRGVEYTGLRELNKYLRAIGAPDDAIKDAMHNAGAIVVKEAWRIMPVDTGKMARTLKANRAKNELKVKVGNNTTVPYAYTFHAVALGKSKGGFTFRVPTHNRRGTRGRKGGPVRAHKAARHIPNRPFLFQAFERKRQEVYEAYITAIGDLISRGV